MTQKKDLKFQYNYLFINQLKVIKTILKIFVFLIC